MGDSFVQMPEARALRLQPGDFVILETDRSLSGDEVARIVGHAKAKFPDNEVVVLSGGLSIGSAPPEEMFDAWADALWPRLRERMLRAARDETVHRVVGLA